MANNDNNKRKPLGLQGNIDTSSLKDKKVLVNQNYANNKSKKVEVEVKKNRSFKKVDLSAKKEMSNEELSAKLRTIANVEMILKEKEIAKEKEATRLLEEKEKELLAAKLLEEEVAKENARKLAEAQILEDAQKKADQINIEINIENVNFSSQNFPSQKEIEKSKDFDKLKITKKDNVNLDEEDNDYNKKKQDFKGKQNKTKNRSLVNFFHSDNDEDEFANKQHIVGIKKLRKNIRSKKLNTNITREVKIAGDISLLNLANAMSEKVSTVIRILHNIGISAKENDKIDSDTAALVITELGHKFILVHDINPEDEFLYVDNIDNTEKRPPIVTIMGHVDHGKTSLLDAIRKTNVVKGEAGGITQHIGAYQITIKSGEKITFIDTPGHEAFTSMRARGANVTDIIILVVAADDGIKAQTIEAIKHAKASGAPVIVAINKIDKPAANANKVRQELLSHDIVVDSLGGDVLDEEVSAIKGTNLDKLYDAIILQADMLNLRANNSRLGYGSVIETHTKKGHGTVATVLVKNGTLKKGDILVIGEHFGRIRMMFDDNAKNVLKALPSFPVEITGISGNILPGDSVIAVSSEEKANDIIEWRKQKKLSANVASAANTFDPLNQFIKMQNVKELPMIIKSDVQGSIEGIIHELNKIHNSEVAIKVIFSGVGDISESDVDLANVSKGVILGFNSKMTTKAKSNADHYGVQVLSHNIIYKAIDDIKMLLSGMLTPEYEEKYIGSGNVIQLFNLTKYGNIAGVKVADGIIRRGANVRILRNGKTVFETTIKSIRHLKNDIKESKEGHECGLSLESWGDIKLGDTINCFTLERIAKSVD